jgi:hypothetical protein
MFQKGNHIMKSLIVILTLALVLAMPALAEVNLPAAAKALTRAEVVALYSGKSTTWDHPYTDKSTGTANFSPDLTTMWGTWKNGKDKGEWEAKISFKKDQYCYQTRPKGSKDKFSKVTCNIVYLDAETKTVYEVHPKNKKILSVNALQ